MVILFETLAGLQAAQTKKAKGNKSEPEHMPALRQMTSFYVYVLQGPLLPKNQNMLL
jgi:hypothetical protein